MLQLLWQKSCTHDKISPNLKCGYCPDCGEYVENKWFISKCNCCGIKQKTLVLNGKVTAEAKFCKNCGNNSFIVEEVEGVDIVSINYAALKKQTKKKEKQSFIQAWIEQNNYSPIKLLPSY